MTVVLIGGPMAGEVLDGVTVSTIDVSVMAAPGVMGCGTYRRVSDHRARWVGWWHGWEVGDAR